MEESSNDIFSIKLSREGVNTLLRFCKLVKFIAFVSIFLYIPSIISEILRMRNSASSYRLPPFLRHYYAILPYYTFFYSFLWLLNIYFYWNFSRALKRSISDINETEFNSSFSYLYNSTVILVITTTLTFLHHLIYLYTTLRFFI